MTYDNVPHIGARIKPEQQKVLYLDVVLSKCVGDSYNIRSKIVSRHCLHVGKQWRTKQSTPLPLPSIQSRGGCCFLWVCCSYMYNIAWRG